MINTKIIIINFFFTFNCFLLMIINYGVEVFLGLRLLLSIKPLYIRYFRTKCGFAVGSSMKADFQ